MGNSPVTGEFPAQRPLTRSFDVFFDLRLNERLSKQPSGWWFGMPSCSLWRHCNDTCLSVCAHWIYLCYQILYQFQSGCLISYPCMQKNERYIKMGKQYKFDSPRNNTHMHTLHLNLHQYFRPRSYRPYMSINLLRPNDAYMSHQPRPSLVHIMVCRLFGWTMWAGCTGDPLHNLTEPYTIHNPAAHHRQSHSPAARLRSAGLYVVRLGYVDGHPWYWVQAHTWWSV